MNFSFLKEQNGYYDLFADVCIEAEKVFATSPAMCAVGCRKALELAVKWVYAADNTMKMPYKDNLASLIHEQSFKQCVDKRVWSELLHIWKLGNLAVHSEKKIRSQDAALALKALFNFVDWIDYCYGFAYEERTFNMQAIPSAGMQISCEDAHIIKEREALIVHKDATIKGLEERISAMSAELTAAKAQRTASRSFNPEEIGEYETRKRYIDTDLRLAGWDLDNDIVCEREVYGMPVEPGNDTGIGFVDYLLFGKDGTISDGFLSLAA